VQKDKFTVHAAANSEIWQPSYGKYSHSRMRRQLEDFANWSDFAGHDSAGQLEATSKFMSNAFSQYSGNGRNRRDYGFVFAIPTRVRRGTDQFASEAAHFLPVVRLMDDVSRQIFLTNLPPCIIDEYGDIEAPHGAIMFVPLFIDMLRDIKNPLARYYTAKKIIADSANFVNTRFNTKILGLGATLPKLTNYGKAFAIKGIAVTTGHSGTTWLIIESIKRALEEGLAKNAGDFGVIGLGAIGTSSAKLILERYPSANVFVHDIRQKVQSRAVSDLAEKYGRRIHACSDNRSVIDKSTIIVSAVTARITIDGMDLSGKLIIDDSQPSSFDPANVHSLGGKLIWVVGHDDSPSQFVTRASDFRFGEEGLLHHGDVWGCEAEVATLWKTDNLALAVHRPVEPSDVDIIGGLMEQAGITVASWQQHGRPLEAKP
jgi:predicted amino acid dehydrogenase